MRTPTIDFSKYEAQSAAPQIDFSKYASSTPDNSSTDNPVMRGIQKSLTGATINPSEPGIIPAIQRFRDRLEGALGGGKIERGSGSAAVPLLGGAILGPPRIAQGVAEMPQHPIKGANNIIGGVGQTVALPMAVANPATIAYAAPSAAIQSVTQRILQSGGVDPDTSEFAGNVAGITTGLGLAKPEIPAKIVKSGLAIAKPLSKLPVLDKVTNAISAIRDIPGDLKDIWNPDSKPTPAAVQAAKSVQSATPPAEEIPKAPIKSVMATDPKTRLTLGDPAQSGDYSVSPVIQGGKEVGRLVYQVEGDRATVHWLGDSAMKNSLSNQLGPVGLRQIFTKFVKQNPDVKLLQGIRAGGANGDAAMSTVYDVSQLYGKSPQENLVPTHQRQLAGQPGRVPVIHTPAPAEQATIPAGPITEPRVPVNDEDMTNLLMESLRQIKAKRGQ